MEASEQRLKEELHKLERLEFELTEQDTLILEQVKRSPDSAVPSSQRDLIWKLFREVEGLGIGYTLPTTDSDNPDSLRPELRSARAKVVWEQKRLNSQLDVAQTAPRDVDVAQNGDGKKNDRIFRTAINEYDRKEILGEGANGTVYKVRDREGRAFALKLLRKELLGGTKQRRFQRELIFSRTAAHPNIIRVLDHGLLGDEGVPFFVMPLFDTTLRKAMDKGIEPGRIPHGDHVPEILQFNMANSYKNDSRRIHAASAICPSGNAYLRPAFMTGCYHALCVK
jgi:serine/threonine protein kinase